MRILIVEDEKKIASFLFRGLKEEHYAVDVAEDAAQGLYLADINTYDLIVLDIMLPDREGISVCRDLRNKKVNALILMLTARSSVNDKVNALDAGADDYLTKPFAFEEFLARVRALLRREHREKGNILKIDDLELDQVSHKVKRAGKEIVLTNKEFSLLQYLLIHQEQIVTRTMISEHVWNESFDSFTNVIDVHINYLRSKIDKEQPCPLIHTVRGAGYILKISDDNKKEILPKKRLAS
ncbi:MAG: response regulator transcription factor [Candidatus Omnitrophica bacterium]|nr:response regulator transcription factor [Candidatus Omnitrophota bacterium]